MKLAEEPRSPRIALRADVRAVIDRIQAGEVIPRIVSALTPNGSQGRDSGDMANEFDESGDRRSPRRPQQQDSNRPARDDERSEVQPPRDESPREEPRVAEPEREQLPEPIAQPVAEAAPVSATQPASAPVAMPTADVDDFAAGIHDDEPASLT